MPDLRRLLELSTARLAAVMQDMAQAIATRDKPALSKARSEFIDQVLVARTIGDLLGREQVVRTVKRPSQLAQAPLFRLARVSPTVPLVTFEEALQALLDRTPELATTAEEVARRHQQGAFVLLRTTDAVVTDRVQKTLARAIRTGADPTKEIQQLGGFTRGYAQTVYRTNLSTAFNEGQEVQAADPVVQDLGAAFRYTTAGDRDVRGNHAAADGFLARTTDSAWRTLTPPLGFNCRCSRQLVLGQSGLPRSQPIPAGAGPDPGFR